MNYGKFVCFFFYFVFREHNIGKLVINNVNVAIENVAEIIGIMMDTINYLEEVSKVADSILPFIPLISEVSRIVSDIINIYQKAEHNKRICGSLLSRATAAETAVKNLEIRRLENESLFKSKVYYY